MIFTAGSLFKKKNILVVFVLCVYFAAFGQRTDKKLQKEIEKICSPFHGTVGVYFKNLKNGKTISINADSLFPTASMVKIPILVGVMKSINDDGLKYHQSITYKDSMLYEGVDILGSFKNDEKIELSKLIMLMMTMSDNTASLWLQSLAGGGEAINRIMEENHFSKTRVNSRTPGRESFRAVYGWGQSTPREMSGLLESIFRKKLISEAACERMMRSLKKNYWDAESLSQIPPTVNVLSKNGAVNRARSEVVLVNAPHGDYVFCVMTKDQNDQSWTRDNEGWELIRNISWTIWKNQERKSKWRPIVKDPQKWF